MLVTVLVFAFGRDSEHPAREESASTTLELRHKALSLMLTRYVILPDAKRVLQEVILVIGIQLGFYTEFFAVLRLSRKLKFQCMFYQSCQIVQV